MGLYDRDYTQSDFQRQRFGPPQMRFNLPRLTPVVRWLLIINIGVFILCLLGPLGYALENWFAIDPSTWTTAIQPWRIITYQFLHSRDFIWHIFFNMIALFFLGPPLERYWGGRKFLPFYLLCGAAGGFFYLVLSVIGFLGDKPMIGASGSVLGLLSACAILFPQFVLFILFFPVPIRVAAIGLAFMYFLLVITRTGGNVGGEAAHLAGMAAGAAYVLLQPKVDRRIMKLRANSWERHLEDSRRLQVEVDRILAKVHRSGLHSLTTKEKRILRKATQEEIRRHQL